MCLIRLVNLELMSKFGVPAWKMHVDALDKAKVCPQPRASSNQYLLTVPAGIISARRDPSAG